jgi:hypothetical protein
VRTPGRLTALYALLVKEYHLTLDQIHDLTPRQIEEIYLHPRDDEGAIQMPTSAPAAPRPSDHIAILQRTLDLIANGHATADPETLEKLKDRIKGLQNGQSG